MMDATEIQELCKKHGGQFHGPNVEHLSIPESSLPALFAEVALRARVEAVPVDAIHTAQRALIEVAAVAGKEERIRITGGKTSLLGCYHIIEQWLSNQPKAQEPKA